jgi:hypothetical protein
VITYRYDLVLGKYVARLHLRWFLTTRGLCCLEIFIQDLAEQMNHEGLLNGSSGLKISISFSIWESKSMKAFRRSDTVARRGC